jgi:antitoxin component YwqK of YwqJK toxin-antitoxin module
LAFVGLLAGLAVWLPARLVPAAGPVEPQQLPRRFAILKDGRLHRTGASQPFTGVLLERYGDGRLQSRSQVLDGRLHGPSEGWHTNGVLQVREHFVAGLSHGCREKWHANGQLQSRASIEQGELHGLFQRWDEQGCLMETQFMKAGVPHGEAVAYHPSGFVKATARFEDGRIVDRNAYSDGERKPAAPATEVEP